MHQLLGLLLALPILLPTVTYATLEVQQRSSTAQVEAGDSDLALLARALRPHVTPHSTYDQLKRQVQTPLQFHLDLERLDADPDPSPIVPRRLTVNDECQTLTPLLACGEQAPTTRSIGPPVPNDRNVPGLTDQWTLDATPHQVRLWTWY